MLNKTKITCSINTDDQIAIPFIKSGMTGNPSSSSSSSPSPLLPASSDTSLPDSHQGATTVTSAKTSETTTVSSGLNERKLMEIEDKIPNESLTSQSTSTTVNTTATASSISASCNMTGNISGAINLKSERLSVNLSASKTFNKLDLNVLHPLASAHFMRKHRHSHLSSSLSRHKRSELRRFNHHRRGGDDSGSEGNTCYTSSSEHSMDTVIFCGKILKSVASNNNLGSPKSSFKPKVPNDSLLRETDSQSNFNSFSNNAKNTLTCHLSQQKFHQYDHQQMTPNYLHHHQNQLIQSPKSSLSNKLSSNRQQCLVTGSPDHSHHSKYKSDHKPSEHKKSSKKLVCDIGTSPLHKIIDNRLLSDELWIDKPKRAKRKKPTNCRFGKELWVDGPAASETCIKQETGPMSTCEFVEKQQRISEWISQHAKTVLHDMSSTPKQVIVSVTTKTASTADTTTTTASSPSNRSKDNESSNYQNSPHFNGHSSQLQDNLVKTKTNEIGCQTDDLIEYVDSIENNYNKIENELDNDEKLMLFNDSYDDDACSEDWNSERHLILLERGALSDCCDKQICCCEGSRFASDDDEDNNHNKKDRDNDNAEYDDDLDDIDVQSEPNNLTTTTEPPRQLKLEQFLKQLITVTNQLTPNRSNLHHHNHQHGHDFVHDQSLRYHHNLPHYHQNNQNAFHLFDTLPPRRYNRSQSLKCSEIGPGLDDILNNCSTNNTAVDPKVNGKNCKSVEDYDISIVNDELPKNHVAFIPMSPRINRILGGTPTKTECLSVTSSSSKSSRKQSSSQHKRDTTSTTTSGHGTTSEGDDQSSVTKKSSNSCSPSQLQFNSSIGSHHTHQPLQGSASSGYDSTIKDEESDREMINESNAINTDKEIMSNMSDNVNNHHGSCNIVKGSAPVKMRDKSDKNRNKNKNEKDKERSKRESISSDKCSFFCCKLTHFY